MEERLWKTGANGGVGWAGLALLRVLRSSASHLAAIRQIELFVPVLMAGHVRRVSRRLDKMMKALPPMSIRLILASSTLDVSSNTPYQHLGRVPTDLALQLTEQRLAFHATVMSDVDDDDHMLEAS
ncbi:hypothetical protein K474DRAFT_503019 [Panus rudis PR-1116 ss-1]|nr:hypothetical protein K474DRAFT_503019 [Panus rudis PR-1116 ss-1]